MKAKRILVSMILCMTLVMSFGIMCMATSKSAYDLTSVTKIKGYATADFLLGKCSGWASTSIVDDQPIVPVQVYVYTYSGSTLKYSDSKKNNTAGVVTCAFTNVSGSKVKTIHYAFANKTATTASNVVKLTVQ